MLSYGKIVFHLSKITRHTKCTHFQEKWEKIGILGNSFLKLNNSNTNQKIHTSCFRRADDNNSKDKTFGKVPPLSQPPPLPSLHSAQGSSTNSDLNVSSPKCGGDINSCPTTCPVYEDCAKANEGSSGSSNYMYWKQTLVVLILTGISLFVFTDWFDDKDKKKKTDALQSKTQKTVNKKPPIVPNPISSKSIPSEVPYLLIGGGTSAFSAFRSIKASDPKAKVLVITKEGDLPYMRPPLSKELWYNKDEVSPDKLNFTQWNGTRRSLFFEPPEFYLETDKLIESEKGGVAVARGWTVKKIDVTNQTVYLQDGHKIKYGKCLIASGASPKNLEIFNSADDNVKEKVMTFRAKEDYLDLLNSIQKPEVKNIVIIGGGLLGSELACSLARNVDSEKKVYQIFKEKSILAQILPKYLSEWATSQVNSEGVNLITNTEVHGCKLKNDRLSLILTNGEVVDADKVVVSIGVTANTDFAEDSLELDTERGGFLVNAELEARSNVWVSGDAACFYDVKLGRRRIEHHDHAVISGRLAGENMTGAKKPYHHQSMFWSDLGPEIGLEAIGIIDSTLETVGVFAEASEAKNVVETDSAVDNKTENKIEIKKDSKTDKNNNEELHSNNSVKEGKELSKQPASKNFDKGVVFYLRNNNVVGILLWNVFNKMSTARQVLARGTKQDEINEIAKLFAIHDD